MWKLILGVFTSIRKFFQNMMIRGVDSLRDQETGKLKYASVKTWKTILFTGLAVVIITVLAIRYFSESERVSGGADKYKEEIAPTLPRSSREAIEDAAFGRGRDPLDALRMAEQDRTFAIGDRRETPTTGVSLVECVELFEKQKAGIPLTPEEIVKARECLENNVAGLNQEELAMAKRLLEIQEAMAGASPEEQARLRREADLLGRYLRGELEPGSLEEQLAKSLARGDRSDALNAFLDGNRSLAEALLAQERGEELTAAQKKLIADYIASGGGTGVGSRPLSPVEGVNVLTQEIASNEAQMQSLRDQLARAQADARQAAERLAQGKPLSAEEQASLQRVSELQRQVSEGEKAQEARRAELARLMQELQQSLSRASKTLQELYPTGFSVNLDEDFCKDVKSLVQVKKPQRSQRKKVMVDLSGKELTPDKIAMLQLYRKQKEAEEDAKRKQDMIASRGLKRLGFIPEATGDINQTLVFSDRAIKTFNLTPDMKLPAVLDSEILVSDKGRGQIVRARFIADVYDPKTNQLIIPKGAIAVATTSGFDPDLGSMDLTFDKVVIGSGETITVNLAVGSADGSMGLRGEVRDTRGKWLLGTFISAFSAGALNWFAQDIIDPYLQGSNAQDALTGASLQGGSEVMQRIAEMYASDLQNAAKIFWVRKGVPMVLFPR